MYKRMDYEYDSRALGTALDWCYHKNIEIPTSLQISQEKFQKKAVRALLLE